MFKARFCVGVIATVVNASVFEGLSQTRALCWFDLGVGVITIDSILGVRVTAMDGSLGVGVTVKDVYLDVGVIATDACFGVAGI